MNQNSFQGLLCFSQWAQPVCPRLARKPHKEMSHENDAHFFGPEKVYMLLCTLHSGEINAIGPLQSQSLVCALQAKKWIHYWILTQIIPHIV